MENIPNELTEEQKLQTSSEPTFDTPVAEEVETTVKESQNTDDFCIRRK